MVDAQSDETARVALKDIYEFLLRLSAPEVTALCRALLSFVEKKEVKTPHDSLCITLLQRYPQGDVGIAASYLMNLVEVPVGDALYIEANIPHAYLSGELVECMANSDNVIRAGLTPKFRDVVTLLDVVEYRLGLPQWCVQIREEQGVIRYDTPSPEFALRRYERGAVVSLDQESPRIFLSITGQGALVQDSSTFTVVPGSAWVLPACSTSCTLELTEGEVFEASVPVGDK